MGDAIHGFFTLGESDPAPTRPPRRFGYTSPQRAGGARRALLEDYRHHTAAIRDVYERILSTGSTPTKVQ